jgi:hypothetical protein
VRPLLLLLALLLAAPALAAPSPFLRPGAAGGPLPRAPGPEGLLPRPPGAVVSPVPRAPGAAPSPPVAAAPTPVAQRPGAPLAAPELCRAAITVAEREAQIPSGLLQALGRVESGRRDPETGRFGPWPWTINAEGRGQFFPTREEAIAAVRQLQARGVRVIDVGCMQINLRHHPDAFPDLETAFDPLANARYAARFLTQLQSTRGDWMRSAAHYHSQTPEFAEIYRARVAAAWPEEQRRLTEQPPAAWAGLPPPRAVATAGRPEAASPPPTRAGEGPRGRGLDAYRQAPIPLAARLPVLAPGR